MRCYRLQFACVVITSFVCVKKDQIMTKKERVGLRIERNRTNLTQRCRNLSDRLLDFAIKLESDKPHEDLSANDLSGIQDGWTTICAEFWRLVGKIDVWFFMNGDK